MLLDEVRRRSHAHQLRRRYASGDMVSAENTELVLIEQLDALLGGGHGEPPAVDIGLAVVHPPLVGGGNLIPQPPGAVLKHWEFILAGVRGVVTQLGRRILELSANRPELRCLVDDAGGDFYLADDVHLIRMYYTDKGEPLGAEADTSPRKRHGLPTYRGHGVVPGGAI
ncbi:MAG: hypothetical protein WCB57_09465 [Pseudonocardiaceae bacterium]